MKCNRTPLMSRNSPIGGLRQRAMKRDVREYQRAKQQEK
jgi:hypothetical protein